VTETFEIVPAGARPALVLIPVLLVLLAVGIVLGGAVHASRSARFELSPAGLRLRGEWLYRSFVPLDSLRGGAARVVDLRSERALRPTSRRFGTGLPGYGGGWFRLANDERALVYLTDWSRVVHVPTTEGFSLLLSVTEPEALAARLRQVAPRP
jgi:hypothetical protein